MNKKATLIVALSCVYAGAANSVNYDLLGRRGSKMNSPMVYKNIDYSKKNSKKQGIASLDNKALMKRASGLQNGVVALEGAYCNKGLDYTTSYPVPFYLKRYYANGSTQARTYDVATGSNGYIEHSNSAFIPVPRWQNYSPNLTEISARTKIPTNQYGVTEENYSFNSSSTVASSRFGNAQDMIHYLALSPDLKEYASKRWAVQSWYDTQNYGNVQEFGKVGVHLSVDAVPVKTNNGANPSFIQLEGDYAFNPTPVTEVASSRMYNTIKAVAKDVVVYVDKNYPVHPAHPTWMGSQGPQVYVGVHAGIDEGGINDALLQYSYAAQNLDNYIYDNRTIEIAGAGNYSVRFNNYHIASKSQAANAVTVGAADGYSQAITSYTSHVSKYCKQGIGNCSNGSNLEDGSKKPEIFNYSHFYLNDKKRTYSSRSGDNYTYTALPLYDGTEVAAAYTASMVADLLTVNPFYRWHPEVVKALLITSGDNQVQVLPSYTPVTSAVPTYQTLLFDKDHQSQFHDSRYWIGDVNLLKTHVLDSKKEIRFSIKRPANKTKFTAAIAWLSSGNDIANLGMIPQDFDLFVYERSNDNTDNVNGVKARSTTSTNAFEKVSFTSSADYLLFRIKLYSDDARSENNGQIVLGFDLAASN